jgi:hypothetical protein
MMILFVKLTKGIGHKFDSLNAARLLENHQIQILKSILIELGLNP